MATIAAITVPNPDAADVLEALEKRWKADAVRLVGQASYDALTGPQKARECIRAELRVITKNLRREQAEKALAAPAEPDVT